MSAITIAARRTVDGIRSVATTLITVCFVFMLVAVGLQVLGRYIVHFNIADFTELATFAQVWMGFLGAGLAMRRGTVFAIESLPAMLPLLCARVLKVAITALSVLFQGLMVYGGSILVEAGFFQTSPTMMIPMWIIYGVIPVGSVYFAFEVILHAIEHWDAPFGNEGMGGDLGEGT